MHMRYGGFQMRFGKSSLLLCIILLVVAFPVYAQRETTVDLNEGYTITIPSDWDVEDEDEYGGLYLYGDAYAIYVLDPVAIDEYINVGSADTATEVLIELYDAVFGVEPNAAAVRKVRIGTRLGSSWEYEAETTEGEALDGIFVILEMSDGTLGALDIYAFAGELGDPLDDLEDMIVSFDAPADEGENTAALTGESCTVSTGEPNSAALRVGPGFNRSSVAFLPANVDVDVTGAFTADDGSEWFQLDKAQAAPQSAAAELWVLRDDVDESGDCDSVGDTTAPPVIPIAVQPPTPVPGAPAPPPATGSITPSTGYWRITLNPTTNASCQGGDNFTFPTVEVYINFPVQGLTVYGEPTTGGLMLDSDFFARAPGTNSFEGSFTFDDGSNSQMRFTLTSATFGAGALTGNFSIDGVPCSATAQLTISR
jgi:hypothetical protein